MPSGLSLPDFLVIGVYFAIVIAIGFWAARRVKDEEDYFLAGRRFGKFIQTFTAFGQGTNVESPVGVATTTFSNGAAGVWSSLNYLFTTPLYWLIAPWMRRLRVLTMADYFEERYGSKAIVGLYTLVATLVMIAHLSVGFGAASKTVVALVPKSHDQLTTAERAELDRARELDRLKTSDYSTLTVEQKDRLRELSRETPRKVFSQLDQKTLIWIICVVVMVYGVAGGLAAAALTDTLQGMAIILLTIMLFPFCWAKINTVYGGQGPLDALATVHARLPEAFFDFLGGASAMDFTWYYIAALSLMTICNTPAQPQFLTSNAAARNEFACRFGATWGSYIKRFCAVLWCFFALCALVIYDDKIQDPDLMWGFATRDLLGSVGFGLVGLMIACLMSALMSTADMLMITSSSLLTKNIYRPLLPNLGERHYVLVGRVLGATVVIAGAFIATQFDSLLQLLKFMWEINVMVAATWWLGMKWRRANRAGAWTSMAFASIFFFLLPILLPVAVPSLCYNKSLLVTTHPRSMTETHHAHQMDVDLRAREITAWEAMSEPERANTPRPTSLVLGKEFKKSIALPARSIFWTKGIKPDDEAVPTGTGMLSLELVALDRLGFNLSANTYAMNETVRILIRTILPFVVLMVVSRLTRPEEKARLDRFFTKMGTIVLEDREADAKELELAYADPYRLDHRKLFPKSQWEFYKWNRVDTIGFLLAVLCAFAVLGFLKLLLMIGA